MFPSQKNDLGKHCFGYATLLVPEFYCEKPKDSLKLAGEDRPADGLAGIRAGLDEDWTQVRKTPDGRVSMDAFIDHFMEKYKDKLVPGSDKEYKKFLEVNFKSSTNMMLPKQKDTLGGHCFRYGALMAGEFYFDQ